VAAYLDHIKPSLSRLSPSVRGPRRPQYAALALQTRLRLSWPKGTQQQCGPRRHNTIIVVTVPLGNSASLFAAGVPDLSAARHLAGGWMGHGPRRGTRGSTSDSGFADGVVDLVGAASGTGRGSGSGIVSRPGGRRAWHRRVRVGLA
jgi:hypothetical protein